MEEKRISKEQFDEATMKAIVYFAEEEKDVVLATAIISPPSVLLAGKIRAILFEENKVENEESNESDIRESKSDN